MSLVCQPTTGCFSSIVKKKKCRFLDLNLVMPQKALMYRRRFRVKCLLLRGAHPSKHREKVQQSHESFFFFFLEGHKQCAECLCSFRRTWRGSLATDQEESDALFVSTLQEKMKRVGGAIPAGPSPVSNRLESDTHSSGRCDGSRPDVISIGLLTRLSCG